MVMRMIVLALWHLMALATGPVPIKALFLEKIGKHQMASSSQFSSTFTPSHTVKEAEARFLTLI